ncbi:MAG TPA: FixH family protein [Ktedonobacteraceae bacterium]|jgi:hypothetical protein
MHVRPVFWCVLVFVCVNVLLFAALVPTHAPALLAVHIEQTYPQSADLRLRLYLTDSNGIPIDDASITSKAFMTNMEMSNDAAQIEAQGHGTYLVSFQLSMSGPWAIHVSTQADGFVPVQETLVMQIETQPPGGIATNG